MKEPFKVTDWLPTTRKEVTQRGWDELDVILFTGDAYVDHPAFGVAVIGRLLEKMGLKVAIVPQPNWQDDLRDFKKMGRPRLFFGVTGGNMDSMVNHYTANRRLRSNDAYTPGGKAGFRPDYASVVYCKALKKFFPDVPILLGGIESSLRRLTHYDYWQDQLKPSLLAESGADLLIYGMGEKPLEELVRLLEKGAPFESLQSIPQTAYLKSVEQELSNVKKWETIPLFSHEECLQDKKKYAMNFRHIEEEANKLNASRLVQDIDERQVVVNPPFPPMSEKDMDASYGLPFTRLPHPKYQKKEAIPAYDMIRHSINLHRGCFGGCSFCTISAHQGKFISSRSKKSIMKEVEAVSQMPDFKGYISDLGGPSANMYKMHGKNLEICKSCRKPSCIFPKVCSNLKVDHRPLLEIYKKVRNHPKVKKAFIGSGVRYDMLLHDAQDEAVNASLRDYSRELITHHVSGRLKVAPEHTSDEVLKQMRKPSFKLFHKFNKIFDQVNKEAGLKQQLIPYFISSHPGCREQDMAELAAETKSLDFKLEQVQDFTPTPMTTATVMYYSGLNPYTLEKVYVAKSKKEKLDQRRFFFWYKREFQREIRQELERMGRPDLINQLFSNGPSTGGKKHDSLTAKRSGSHKSESSHNWEDRPFRSTKSGSKRSNGSGSNRPTGSGFKRSNEGGSKRSNGGKPNRPKRRY